jgi:RHS repeat-associated protein
MIRKYLRAGLFFCFMLLSAGANCQSKTVTYYYTDQQGTPLAETDESGNVIAVHDYTPSGSPAIGQQAGGPGFTGHVGDVESSFVYMQARFYDPSIGRFISRDPIPLSAGDVFKTNRFVYANNNSYRYTDPDGRCPDACVIEGPVIIGGGVVYGVAAGLVAIGVCVEACGKIQRGIESAAVSTINTIKNLVQTNEAVPALPGELVGDDPKATGKNGGTAIGTSLPGGKFADTVKDLTGDSLGAPDSKGRSVSPNGVSVRTGGKSGPRIDIPANGTKPPEIIHFPEDTPIPDHLKPPSV